MQLVLVISSFRQVSRLVWMACGTKQKKRPGGSTPDHVSSNPTLYRFRSVSFKVASSDEGISLSKRPLLEVTSGTLVSAVPENLRPSHRSGLPLYWKCREPLLP